MFITSTDFSKVPTRLNFVIPIALFQFDQAIDVPFQISVINFHVFNWIDFRNDTLHPLFGFLKINDRMQFSIEIRGK